MDKSTHTKSVLSNTAFPEKALKVIFPVVWDILQGLVKNLQKINLVQHEK